MKNYDLYLMTSYTESFGLVLLEALSQSLPCIAFDSASGAKKLLANSCGVLVPNRDKKLYAKQIIDLLNNTKKISELSNKGYKSTKQYDIKNVKNKWLELLNKAK